MKESGPTREGPWSGLSEHSDILDATMVQGDEPAPAPRSEYPPGTAVSRYVILYEVGAGGMGVVYAAFDPQLNRKIALKILVPKKKQRKRSADQAATRLMREAQAIARLSHPNVVNVYDVGRHRESVFVAMEFIEGVTLTRWLEQEDRSLADIRRIFAAAGRGLAAAHEAGLVHRDFKPDNVLVSADGRVRVLDFGLARADPTHASHLSHISQVSHVSDIPDEEDDDDFIGDGVPHVRDLGESDVLSSPLTLDDTVVGTPRYMAPEQHAGVGVDARSDQFSFCVALYQALYGQEPFPANRLHDLVRLKQRGTIADIPPDANTPPWLTDLVLRGLSPRPVSHGGRRRRFSFIGGAVLLAAVTAAAGHQLGSGERLCQDSEAHLEGLWDDERRQTIESAILGTGLPYAEHTWGEVERRVDADLEQWVTTHRDTCEATRVRGEQSDELLDLRMQCLDDHLGEVRAMLDVLSESDPAVVQRAVGVVSGLPSLERCANVEQLRARLPPPEDEATKARVEEVRDLMRQSQASRAVRRMEEARRLAEQALGEAEALGYEPLRVEALAALGVVLENAGEYPESEAHLREAMWAALRIGHDHVASRAAIQLVSVVGDRLARYDEGLTWAEQAEAWLDHMGEEGAARISLFNNQGNVWHRKNDNEKALDYYQRAIALREQLSGDDGPALAIERVNLGNAQMALGRYDDAVASYQQSEASLRRALGSGHPQIAMAVASLGVVFNAMGRFDEALVQHRRALPDFEAWLGPEHLFVATTISNIAVALHGLDDLDGALQQFRRAQQLLEKSLGPEHPQVAAALHNLGAVRKDQGLYDEAFRLYERALELRRKRFDDEDVNVVATRIALAELRRLRKDPAGAVTALENLATVGEEQEMDPRIRGAAHFELALARWDAGQVEVRVRADMARAEEFLIEAGAGGESTLEEIRQWEREHLDDDRPRAADGTILPVTSDEPSEGDDDAGRDGPGDPGATPTPADAALPEEEPLPRPTPPPPAR